ncbi:TNF receptor-associated factor 5 isoform X1 [Hydra vulgaris]|uniref:TNF receptor-associated factor 5 isoform X1 n=1 Tax=Hydra vulgaris TaxID=6087 RepID=UPI0006417038|nr:TNF receptor-associated factor 5-like [Hydra vulgaris]XP_047128009.1 TNF receptor-associated factor 5-like [Hydra vulgaris]
MDISRSIGLNHFVKANPVENINAKYLCKICTKLLYNPIQTGCGERFCESCVKFTSSGKILCPVENVECIYFYDKFANKEIEILEFECPFNKNCNWSGKLIKLKEEHLNSCDYKIYICEKCGEEVIQKNFNEHSLNYCSHSFFTCLYCDENVSVKDKIAHLCLKLPVTCLLDCGATFLYEDIITHLNQCNNLKNICVYRLIGCKLPLINSVEEHYKSDVISHNHLMMVFVQELSVKQMTLKNEVSKLSKENLELCQKLELVKKYGKEINDLKKTVQIQVDESASIFQGLSLQVNDLKEANFMQAPVDKHNKKLSFIERSQEKLNESYNDLHLSQQILENTSYDGHLLWKISSYKQRSMAAMSGTIPALHSAPCYTSRFGYKYCLRLYLNGDGAGKGSYISLFFVLMKSDYDSLHKWPFQNKVTFRLRAKNPEYDIVESFTPDKNSSSFIKPVREMNIAAGVPLFAKKSDINENFILDDAIFIESKVYL